MDTVHLIRHRFYAIGFALLLAYAIAGCTTKQEHEAILNSWLGSTEKDIVTSWGPPDGFYEVEHQRYLTWKYSSTVVIPGTPSNTKTTNYGNYVSTWTTPGRPPVVVDSNCSITMIVQFDAIVSWSYKGNSCYDF